MMRIVSNNERETYLLGKKLGIACRGGEVFLLCGELGSGKTKLTQGLAEGLGITGTINSPTFNIMKIYQPVGAPISLCHIDAYRLKSAADLVAIGALDYLGVPQVVAVIEWADRVKDIWMPGARLVRLKSAGAAKRQITISSWPAKAK